MKKVLAILAILFFTAVLGNSVNAQETTASDKAEEKTQQINYDQNIEIKKKPHPRVGSGCERFSGRTRVLVTFDKSEKVTDVEIVASSGCPDFDLNAVRAAKGIKFKAATKNGEPVTVKKQIEYSYMLGRRGV